MPKSSSFAVPRAVRKMFSGLMSRWTIPFACAHSRASASWWRCPRSPAPPPQPVAESRLQRLAFQKLHHEERRAIVLADVVERADVGVVQAGDGLRFPREARAAIRIGAQFCGQDLDGDCAVETGVAFLVDLAHAAGADSRLDLVGSEASPGDEAHGHGLRGALYAALSQSCACPQNLSSVPEQGGPGGCALLRPRGLLFVTFAPGACLGKRMFLDTRADSRNQGKRFLFREVRESRSDYVLLDTVCTLTACWCRLFLL